MLYSDAFEKYRTEEARVKKWVELFASTVEESDKKVLLDCGCGVGRFTVPLSAMFSNSFGVDRDLSMLQVAKEKANHIHWIQSDVTQIPLSNASVDVILASMLIEHLHSVDMFAGEASRILKDKGRLLLRTMLPKDIDYTTWYGFSEHARALELERTYDLERLKEVFLPYGFEFSKERSILHVTECFDGSRITDKLKSKCYQVIHKLNEEECKELLAHAEEWVRQGSCQEIMSSSLVVFTRR